MIFIGVSQPMKQSSERRWLIKKKDFHIKRRITLSLIDAMPIPRTYLRNAFRAKALSIILNTSPIGFYFSRFSMIIQKIIYFFSFFSLNFLPNPHRVFFSSCGGGGTMGSGIDAVALLSVSIAGDD